MSVDTAINVISLCAGGGGLDRGLNLALPSTRTICWVEWEGFPVEVLAESGEKADLDSAPIWTDLRTFDGTPWRGVVDIITAGYPCQPFSLAGRRGGSEDVRHLWPHVARVIRESQPPFVFLENVSGHLSLGFGEVAAELEGMGYEVAAGLFTAQEVGASHRRERLFILAHSDGEGPQSPGQALQCKLQEEAKEGLFNRPQLNSGDVADAYISGLEGWKQPVRQRTDECAARTSSATFPLFPPTPDDLDSWEYVLERDISLAPAEPTIRVLADGLGPDRTRWLKLFGNGVVPLQAAYAFCSLWSVLRFTRGAK